MKSGKLRIPSDVKGEKKHFFGHNGVFQEHLSIPSVFHFMPPTEPGLRKKTGQILVSKHDITNINIEVG